MHHRFVFLVIVHHRFVYFILVFPHEEICIQWYIFSVMWPAKESE